MKQNFLPFVIRILGSLFITLTVNAGAFAWGSGSPAGYTGSPGDGKSCSYSSCHGGSTATVTGWITSTIPAQGYTPGTVYTITAVAQGTGKKGFQVSPQNASGTQLGVLAAGSNNHLVGGTKYVTQNSTGSSSGNVTYTFTWTAPEAGTGPVTFYGAFTVGVLFTKLCTLVVNEFVPLSATASATPAEICAGQTSQLEVTVGGGTGSYAWSWTSDPPGFTSTLQNPVVSPLVSTQYLVTVSDGMNSVNASTNVNVGQPATAGAGTDTVCAYVTTEVPLNGTASYYSSVLWTTSGTGTFSAAGSLAGFYYPSQADKEAGDITLTLTAAAQYPCTAAASDARIIHFNGPTGLADGHDFPGLVVSPNPSHGSFEIKFHHTDDGNAEITVSDLTGRRVLNRTVTASSSGRVQFDLSGSPRGLYFVTVRMDAGTTVKKLIIE